MSSGICCVCQMPITGIVSYTQHCHDECYIKNTRLDGLKYWYEAGLINPAHWELAKKRLEEENKMNEQIIPRDKLIDIHSKDDKEEIEKAIRLVNSCLTVAKSLPVYIVAGAFGNNTRVRIAVVQMMKNAGYRCCFENNRQEDYPEGYYVVE